MHISIRGKQIMININQIKKNWDPNLTIFKSFPKLWIEVFVGVMQLDEDLEVDE